MHNFADEGQGHLLTTLMQGDAPIWTLSFMTLDIGHIGFVLSVCCMLLVWPWPLY